MKMERAAAAVEGRGARALADVHLLYGLALRLQRAGKLDEARRRYESILVAQPDHAASLRQLGIVHLQQGRHAIGVQRLTESLHHDDSQAETHAHLGDALLVLQQHEAALLHYERALACRSDFAHVHLKRGHALSELGRHEEALQSYQQVLALQPDDGWAHFCCGNALRALGRHAQSLASYDAALARNPRDAWAHANRGAALNSLDRPEEAVPCYDRAISLAPDEPQAYSNRGNALLALNRQEEAIDNCRRAIALKPDFAEAHWNLSLAQLSLGQYVEGWRGYEWRWTGGPRKLPQRRFAQPLWLGAPALDGQTLLVHAEQGLGDSLQMCRYLPLLLARGARVVLEVQPALTELLRHNFPQVQVLAQGDALPAFDLHCPMMSLPHACQTTLQTIPGATAYLSADPARARLWKQRLGETTKRRVGLAWSGSPTHTNDRHRSLPLSLLEDIVGLEFDWHALHKDVRVSDQPALSRSPLTDHAQALTDFSDTAALLSQLDLVITVDTAVAHLAGAMGKPVWLMLPFMAEYRWLVARSDSPWYGSARLFRQPVAGDWRAVAAQIVAALGAFKA